MSDKVESEKVKFAKGLVAYTRHVWLGIFSFWLVYFLFFAHFGWWEGRVAFGAAIIIALLFATYGYYLTKKGYGVNQ